MRKPVIYKIINTLNNEYYLGSTCNFLRRKKEHLYDLRNNCHHSYKLQNAFNKFTEDNFIFKIENKYKSSFSNKDLKKIEQKLLDKSFPAYNVNLNSQGWSNDLVPVVRMTILDEIDKYYPSLMAANIDLGKDPYDSGITSCINGRQKTSSGYKWIRNEDRKSEEYLIEISKNLISGHTPILRLNPHTGEVLDYGFVGFFKDLGFDTSTINKVVLGQCQHHKGFLFKRYEPYPTKNLYLGIDTGFLGGIVLLDEFGNIKFKTPIFLIEDKKKYDLERLSKYIKYHRDYIIASTIEEVYLIHGTAKSVAFKMGYGLGIWKGILTSLGLGFYTPSAKEWQSKVIKKANIVLDDRGKNDTKKTAVKQAFCLWPNEDFKKSSRAKNPHDGMVDAALIAEYGRIIN